MVEPMRADSSRVGSFLLGKKPMRRRKKKVEKKKLNTLDKYIIYCLSFISLYTIAHTVIFAITGLEAKVLDALVFSAFAGELLLCFLIKRFKLHEEAKIVFGKKKENNSDVDEPFTDDM